MRCEHPAVMPGIAVASAVFVSRSCRSPRAATPYIGYDAHAYYQAAALDDPYRTTINGGFDAAGGLYEYKYPPPLAQILHPLRVIGISWPAFLGAWTILLLASLAWMGRRWTLAPAAVPARPRRAVAGQPQHPARARRSSSACATRRRGRSSCSRRSRRASASSGSRSAANGARSPIALVATVTVVGVSFVLAPWLWSDFIEASRTQVDATVNVPRQAAPIALPLRLVVAALLVAWAGRTDRAWVVPIAAGLAVPFLWWNAFAVMVAAVPLYALATRRRQGHAAPGRGSGPIPAHSG